MNKPYNYEIPIPLFHSLLPRKGVSVIKDGVSVIKAVDERGFKTIEKCVEACKAECKKLGVDYNSRRVKLFMTDSDGKWEVTEEGEIAG